MTFSHDRILFISCRVCPAHLPVNVHTFISRLPLNDSINGLIESADENHGSLAAANRGVAEYELSE